MNHIISKNIAMITRSSSARKRLEDVRNNSEPLPWCSMKKAGSKTIKKKSQANSFHIRGLDLNYNRKKDKHINCDTRSFLEPSPVSIHFRKHSKVKYIVVVICLSVLALSFVLHLCMTKKVLGIEQSEVPENVQLWHQSHHERKEERVKCLLSTLERTKKALRRLQKISRRLKHQEGKVYFQHPYFPTDADYASSTRGGYAEAMSGVHTQEGRDIILHGMWGSLKLWNEAMPPPARLNSIPTWPPVPGDCWPMKGQEGGVVINLWTKIYLKSISILHIRPDIQKSAPRDFEVYVIFDNRTMKFVSKGQYKTEDNHWQNFPVKPNLKTAVQRLAFRISSNQGNPQHTCVYRIQVHGVPAT